ncbi:hypothetical protein AN640_01650, partial [Candidatus Epulonipiscium fishelsonii]
SRRTPQRRTASYNRTSSKRRNEPAPAPSSSPMGGLLLLGVLAGGIYAWKGEEIKPILAPYIETMTPYIGQTIDKIEQIIGNTIDKIPTMKPVVSTYSMPCIQSNIVKILATTLYDTTFMQPSPDDEWYTKYYRVLSQDATFNYLTIDQANQPVTHELASRIINDILGEGYFIELENSEAGKSQAIGFEQFLNLYDQALDTRDNDKMEIKELSIAKTNATHSNLLSYTALTDTGIYGFEGLILDPLVDHTIKVAMVGNEILGVMEVLDTQVKLNKCFIVDIDADIVTIQIGEEQISYTNTNNVLSEANIGNIVNLQVKNGDIIDFMQHAEALGDTVLRVTNEYIEFEKAGKLPYNNVAVYDKTWPSEWTNLVHVSSGSTVDYVLEDGFVTSLKVTSKPNGQNMRVVITEDGLIDYNHATVQLQTAGELYYNNEIIPLNSDEVWDVEQFDWIEGIDKIIIKPTDTFTINSINRQQVNPTYSGDLEIYKEDVGYTLVNDVEINDYLAGVIPSEMPTSYGLEAAKVQAISARSYAIAHQTSSKFVKYGAQVDDTISSQVYNNIPTNANSIQAAEETDGLVLKYDGEVVSGNFFSTSSGHTANAGETWAEGEIFPLNTPVYLSARQQYLGEKVIDDLSNEMDAYEFFTKTEDELDAFDEHAPWFRWNVSFDNNEFSQIVNNNIGRLSLQYGNILKVLGPNNNWETATIDNIGQIKDIEVKERGEGGNIMSLVIVGEKETIKVETEYLIRTLLSPVQKDPGKDPIEIIRNDGSVITNMSMLPSAFFSIDITYNEGTEIEDITLYGGGFGHGVGMSQEGVRGMVNRGYTYREILQHYYEDIEIAKF